MAILLRAFLQIQRPCQNLYYITGSLNNIPYFLAWEKIPIDKKIEYNRKILNLIQSVEPTDSLTNIPYFLATTIGGRETIQSIEKFNRKILNIIQSVEPTDDSLSNRPYFLAREKNPIQSNRSKNSIHSKNPKSNPNGRRTNR